MYTKQEVKNIILLVKKIFPEEKLTHIKQALIGQDKLMLTKSIANLYNAISFAEGETLKDENNAVSKKLLDMLKGKGELHSDFADVALGIYASHSNTTSFIKNAKNYFEGIIDEKHELYQEKILFDIAIESFENGNYTEFEAKIQEITQNLTVDQFIQINNINPQLRKTLNEMQIDNDFHKQIIDDWVFFNGKSLPIASEDINITIEDDDKDNNIPIGGVDNGDTTGGDAPGDGTGNTNPDDGNKDDITDKPQGDLEKLIEREAEKLLGQIEDIRLRALVKQLSGPYIQSAVTQFTQMFKGDNEKLARAAVKVAILSAKLKYYNEQIDQRLKQAGITDKSERRFIISALISGWDKDPKKLKAAIVTYFKKNNKKLSEDSLANLEGYFDNNQDEILTFFRQVNVDTAALNDVKSISKDALRKFIIQQVDVAILGMLNLVGIDKVDGLAYANPEGFWQRVWNVFITAVTYIASIAISLGVDWAVNRLESKLTLNKLESNVNLNETKSDDFSDVHPFSTKEEREIMKSVDAAAIIELASRKRLKNSKYIKLSAKKVNHITDNANKLQVELSQRVRGKKYTSIKTYVTFDKKTKQITSRDFKLDRKGNIVGVGAYARVYGNKNVSIIEGKSMIMKTVKVEAGQKLVYLNNVIPENWVGDQFIQVSFNGKDGFWKQTANGITPKAKFKGSRFIKASALRKLYVSPQAELKFNPVKGYIAKNYYKVLETNGKTVGQLNIIPKNWADSKIVTVFGWNSKTISRQKIKSLFNSDRAKIFTVAKLKGMKVPDNKKLFIQGKQDVFVQMKTPKFNPLYDGKNLHVAFAQKGTTIR